MKVLYDTYNWPYVKVKFTNKGCSDKDFKEHLDNFRNLYKLCDEKKSKMCVIFDLRDIPINGMRYVQQQVVFNKEIKPLSTKHLEYSLFLTSTIGKHLLDMVFSIEPPVSPYTIFNNEKTLFTFIKNYDCSKMYNSDMCENNGDMVSENNCDMVSVNNNICK